jgi:hypothetical protein
MTTTTCCAECGKEEGDAISLKACKSCWLVKYCNAECQRNHWAKHKKVCKLRAAELRDEALFKDPPPKEDCPICFLPMPVQLINCVSLPPATISSVPINDCANEHEELAKIDTKHYYSCCGTSICGGCIFTFCMSGMLETCPFCKSEQYTKTDEDRVEELMKRVEVNDAGAIYALGNHYNNGNIGLQQDREKALELWTQAAALGSSQAHCYLGNNYNKGGDLKKTKFHMEAAAMAGHEVARFNLGVIVAESGNMERALKHWIISASAGHFVAMHHLRTCYENGIVSRESIDSTLTAYNNSCTEIRSEARDAYIHFFAVKGGSSKRGTMTGSVAAGRVL